MCVYVDKKWRYIIWNIILFSNYFSVTYILSYQNLHTANTGRWGSAQCSDQSPRRVCTVCEFDTKKTKFSLRGLCQDSRHDRVYILEKDGQLKPFFKGLSTTIIRWNSTKLHWHLDHLRYKTQGFFYDETKKEYPIGRRQWLLDDRKCDLNDDLTWLTLTSCSQSEYTCTDGTCIPLEYRCDLKADCIDRSDEEDCRKVTIWKIIKYQP